MSLRIAFDLDGTIADLDGAMTAIANELFPRRPPRDGSDESPSHPPSTDATAGAAVAAPAGTAATASTSAEPQTAVEGDPPGAEQEVEAAIDHQPGLSARQHQAIWRAIHATENFWETLAEIEPGSVARLARLAAERHWEVIFLTQRPTTAGDTAQVQSQRWLKGKGFPMPSVFVVPGGRRGRIANALDLHVVVDDRPENCLDVNVESRARPILVWRADPDNPMVANAKRLDIGTVSSINECLDALCRAADAAEPQDTLLGRLKKYIGLGK